MSNATARGHSFKLAKPFCKLTFAQHFFACKVVNVWNSLPENVVCAKTLAGFKHNLLACSFALYCKGEVFK
jgi:hypothetical protein